MTQTPKPVTKDIIRLTPAIYREFAKQFMTPHVDDQTSPLQAGFQLGVQAVLTKLREELTIRVEE